MQYKAKLNKVIEQMHTVYMNYTTALKTGDTFVAAVLEKHYTALYNKRNKYEKKNKQREGK